MSNKILYQPTEGTTGFWGLRGIPEKPEFKEIDSFLESSQKAIYCYHEALESCKSNKLEIVNIDEQFTLLGCADGSGRIVICGGTKEKPIDIEIKPGDIFDLPIGYEFKEEWHTPCIKHKDCLKPEDGWKCMSACKIGSMKVLRLVKTETKEHSVTGPWDCQDENVLAKFYGSQPEPEESQEELLKELLKMHKFTENTNVLKHFTIQRKKQ